MVPDMADSSQSKLYSTALQTIHAITQLPGVRVDRHAFLRQQFKDSPYLDVILAEGPQVVYSVESLRKKCNTLIKNSAAKTSMMSFASGLPGNPAIMIAAGGADVAQYFGFALNLAQQIAYVFGENDLFDESELSETAQIRVIGYLGAMFGAAGASALIANTSKVASANLGKKFAAQGLMKTGWYPLVKKVGAAIGQKVTRATVEKTVTKAVPLVGGVVSGGLTYVTFRPMGHRLADTLVRNLNGEFDDDLDLNPDFAARANPNFVVVEPTDGP